MSLAASVFSRVTLPRPVPRVSLVMTVYNAEAYLSLALESILGQTFEDWELIVWDDGSTDGSVAIAREYAEEDGRIRLFEGAENVGQGRALVQAHERARGEFVGWVDADDLLAPTALAETTAFLREHERYGMVYTSYIDIDEAGNELGLGRRCQIPYSAQRMLVDLLTFHFRLVRRSVYEAVGGVNPEIVCAEDYDLFLRISEICEIYHLQKPLYFYRCNSQGLSHVRSHMQRSSSARAVNLALARRGMSKTHWLQVDPETGVFRLKRRSEKAKKSVRLADEGLALFEQGKVLAGQGELAGAVDCFQKAIERAPGYLATYNQLGNAYQQLGDFERAIGAYQALIGLNPAVAQAHCNLGAVWQLQGQLDEAEMAYERAIELKPGFAIAHLNLAKLLALQGKPAKEQFAAAVAADPGQVEAQLGLGQALLNEGALEEARTCLERVLVGDEGSVEALLAMGRLCEAQGELPEALTHYQQLFDMQADYRHVAVYQLSFVRRQLCEWENYEADTEDLLGRIGEQVSDESAVALPPLSLSVFPVSPALHEQVNRHYAGHVARNMAEVGERCQFVHDKKPTQRLKIGYVSPDFREHPVGWLVQDIFRHHDRERFAVYGYSLRNRDDAVQATVRAGCDVFVDCSELSAEAIAQRIYADGIHVLVDLAGYTTYSCPGLFALRPAPVQCGYLGYPDTTGASYMDYLLADEWVVPRELAAHCTEKVVWLPHQFVVSAEFGPLSSGLGSAIAQKKEQSVRPSDRKAHREACGLPADGFVFCCFNTHRKIDPSMFSCWMRILEQVSDSVLWLSNGPEETKNNLRREAKARNVNPNRLRFAPRVSLEDYLTRYDCADLFLDTFSYSAGSTAVCALASGVPLLTYPSHT
ncbi:MAG: glycosyltransferase, partial [Cyanobacteria bacterium J06614_10]